MTKVLSASLLGDGSIEAQSKIGGRFSIRQKEDHKDHLDYIHEIISDLGSSFYYTEAASYPIKGKMCNISGAYTLRTRSHPMLKSMHERMYLNKVKVVDPHYLTLIDSEFMAVWYQQDGYLKQNFDATNPTPSVALCTDCFSYGDQMLLRRAIIEKTGFIFNVQKRSKNKNGEQTYRLYLSRKQTDQFLVYVQPFIQPSFYYKIER